MNLTTQSSLKGIGIVGLILLFHLLGKAQNITQIEYFFDVDPGIGAATPIPITPMTEIDNLNESLDISMLDDGFHFLSLRSMDENGVWSLNNNFPFFVGGFPASSDIIPDVSRIEYFLDTDPGFGNATAVSFTPSTDISNLAFNVDISGLNEGFHRLVVRAENADGDWSFSNQYVFFKGDVPLMSNPDVVVTDVEYYLDTDPGFGNGTPIPVTAAAEIGGIVLNVDIASLNAGFHRLVVRSKDDTGGWSVSNQYVFFKDDVPLMSNPESDIVEMEYFLNADPGFGNGTPVMITQGMDVASVALSIDISGLGDDFHHLSLRSKNADGDWSLTNRYVFFKGDIPIMNNTAPEDIVKVEYFLNADPGFGNGTDVSITPGTDINNHLFNIDISALDNGFHLLSIRSQNADGDWSLRNTHSFFKADIPIMTNDAPNLTALEYFFDSDPGFGNGTAINLPMAMDTPGFAFSVNISGLSFGTHILFIRSRDENGDWSFTHEEYFIKIDPADLPTANIEEIEYFFNTDPGFGNGTSVSITPSPNIENQAFSIDISALTDDQIHHLYIRSKDENGNWSLTNEQMFLKMTPIPDPVAGNIDRVEYFIDSDPGFGLGTMVPITPGQSISGLFFQVDISALSDGFHQLVVRSRDIDGKWSLSSIKDFFIGGLPGNNDVVPDIVDIEYYFNDDPGYGNGTPISFTQGTNVENLSFSIDISGLPLGFNRLVIRSKNADGDWSFSNQHVFYKDELPAMSNPDSDIVEMEYFLNDDPGFGNGTALSFTPGTEVSNVAFQVDISGLPTGFNRLEVRSKNALGDWSPSNQFIFFKDDIPTMTSSSPDIVAMEYYLDDDPGFGNGVELPVTSAQDINGYTFSVDISSLADGFHRLVTRSQNADGNWSLSNQYIFFIGDIPTMTNELHEIVAMEYFIDTDPGFGNGTPIPVTPGTDIPDFVLNIDISTLVSGEHTLSIRSQDASGDWSLTNHYIFNNFREDIGVTAFVSPVEECEFGMEEVIVTIFNYGGLEQTGFDVSYSINGGTPVVENVGSLVLPSGNTSIDYAFTTFADVTGLDEFTIEASTSLTADTDNNNDTLSVTFNSLESDATNVTALTCDPNMVGTTMVTLTNQFGCDSLVITNTILDNIAPTAICQDITIALDGNGDAVLNASDLNNGSTDNCGIQSYTANPSSFTCNELNANTVVLTVTDIHNNTATCQSTVTVIDNLAPIISNCPADVMVEVVGGVCSTTATWTAPTADDNCNVAIFNASHNPGDSFTVGTTTVSYTASDDNGNTTSCSFNVTVTVVQGLDATASPNPACFGDDVQLMVDDLLNATYAWSGPNSFSSSEQNPVLNSITNLDLGTYTVTVSIPGCTIEKTVELMGDMTAPVAVCQDLTVSFDENGEVNLTGDQVDNGSTDNCGVVNFSLNQTAFDCQSPASNTVTLSVTDDSGNSNTCSAVINLEDTTPPVIPVNPVDVSIACDQEDFDNWVDAQMMLIMGAATDNCGIQSYSNDAPAWPGLDCDFVTVTFFVEDDAGLISSVQGTYTVFDDQLPTLAGIPADMTINCEDNVPAIPTIIGSDNCDNDVNIGFNEVSTQTSNGSCSDYNYTITRTWTAEDNCGNQAMDSQVITVVDQTNPSFTIPSNITIECTDDTSPANTGNPTNVNDNCDSNPTVTHTDLIVTGSIPTEYTIERTWKIEDICGNFVEEVQIIEIEDTTSPMAICQDLTIGLDMNGAASITSSDINNGSSDNCSLDASLTFGLSQTDFDCTSVGMNTVTLTVTDEANNSGTCQATVEITESVPPVLNCPPSASIDCSISQLPAYSDLTEFEAAGGTATDNCGLNANSLQLLTEISDNQNCPETVTRTYELADVGGNLATCTHQIEINDEEAPVAICQDITINLDDTGNAQITADDINNNSTDNCGISTTSIEFNITTFECSDIGIQDVNLIVEDECGNTSNCTASVYVQYSAAGCTPPDITNDGGPLIGDPCTCRGNGEFDEEVFVSAPSGMGNTWLIQSTTLLDPITFLPFPPGTTLTEYPQGGGSSLYAIQGVHLDGVGYQIEVINPTFYPGVVLTQTNVCYYPQISFTDLNGDFCLNSPPVPLVGDANGATGTETITINGMPATEFDPSVWGIGTHTVEYTFDAGTAGAMDPTDPGCVSGIVQTVDIIETPTVLACNDSLLISLDENCQSFISPDIIMEGSYGCFDDYVVYISNVTGTSVPNPVPGAFLNQWLTVTVEHLVSGNSCWGHIQLEDKWLPEVLCSAPVQISCSDDLSSVLPPAAIDNCDMQPSVLLINEEYIDDDLCDDNQLQVRRTWIAVDNQGNESAPCDEIITIDRITDIDFPNDIVWHCEQYDDFPNIVEANSLNPAIMDQDPLDEEINVAENVPSGTLSSTGSGNIDYLNPAACNYAVSYEDEILEACGEGFKIIRTWTVLDWCTNAIITSNSNGEDNVQIIKVSDQKGPEITITDQVLAANNPAEHPAECTSTECLPGAEVIDNCNEFTLRIFSPVGELIYNNGVDGLDGGCIPEPGLPLGDHDISYVAEDACGNISEVIITLTVIDDIAPTAVCDELTSVSLSSDGLAVVDANEFDDGSHDNCCIDYFEVRRMEDTCGNTDDLNFGPTVTFCCEDIDASPINIQLRVYDCYNNSNDCMVQVIVEDKLNPINTTCPDNLEITCDNYWEELEASVSLEEYEVLDQYGNADFYDNCAFEVDYDVAVNIDQCGEGSIVRSWVATDPSDNVSTTCTQTISVHHVSDFVVEFPANLTATCGNEAPDFGEPTIFNESCELVAVSYSDQHFDVVDDACYKIIRQWVVINWCVVGSEINQENFAIEVPEDQLGIDLNGDGVLNERTFRDSWNGIDFPGTAEANNQFGPDSDPDSDPWDGYITYQQIIKVIDEEAPVFVSCEDVEICIYDGCSETVSLAMPELTDCSDDVTVIIDSSTLPNANGVGLYENVPPGTYEVVYLASDNCGNSNACSIEVTVTDCKNPTPYCVEGLVVNLMENGMVDVWAVDFDAGSFDNCQLDCVAFSPDCSDTQRIFDCADIGQQFIEIWVFDGVNWDFCETFVEVQDNNWHCDDAAVSYTFSGNIANEDNEMVEEVTIELSGQSNMSMITDENGTYSFEVPEGNDVSITPTKDIDPLNGVTTFDLVKISKHILNVEALSSPYKMIAADANKSNSITTFDLVSIRKLILFIDTEFPNNTSWRFVPKEYEFADSTNPFTSSFPEVISYNNLDEHQLSQDFVAIKIGDVNNSANTNGLQGTDDRSRDEILSFIVEDRQVQSGEEIEIAFRAADFNYFGYQFTLDFKEMEFVGIGEGIASKENFGLSLLKEGAITVSWNNANALELAQEEIVFTLKFQVNKSDALSQLIQIGSRFTPSEAYRNDGELTDVQLIFVQAVDSEFVLYQNEPNPFSDQTSIGFDLPEACKATLMIYDGSGKRIFELEGNYSKGYNKIKLDKRDLNKSGVMYYQLKCPYGIATKKMVIVK